MDLNTKYNNDIAFSDLKRFNIEIIPHSQQSYETWGDYWVDDQGVMQIRISEFENRDYSFYVLMHELAEIWRVVKRGLSMSAITQFDLDHPESDDPGTLPDAPYHTEHMQSMCLEELLLWQDRANPADYENVAPKEG